MQSHPHLGREQSAGFTSMTSHGEFGGADSDLERMTRSAANKYRQYMPD